MNHVREPFTAITYKISINYLFPMRLRYAWADNTHIVLDVRFAPAQEEDPASLIVPVLAAEVERGEPASVLDVRVGLGAGQKVGWLAETLPWGLVEGCVAVLENREVRSIIYIPLFFIKVCVRIWFFYVMCRLQHRWLFKTNDSFV